MFKHLYFFLEFTSKKRKIQLLIFLAFTLLSSILEVFSLGAIFPFVALFSDSTIIFQNENLIPVLKYFQIDKPSEVYLPITVIFFLISSASYILKGIVILYRSKISRSIALEISSIMYWKIIKEKYNFHTNQNSSDIITGLTQSFGVASSLFLPILKSINSFLIILIASVGIFLINYKVAIIIILALIVFYYSIGIIIDGKLKSFSDIQNKNYSKIIKIIQESLGAIKIIILSGGHLIFYRNYKKISYDYLNSISKVEYIGQLPKLIFEYLIIVSIIAIIYVFNSQKTIDILVPLIITFVISIQRLLPEINQLYTNTVIVTSKKSSLERIINYLKINKQLPNQVNQKIKIVQFQSKLEIKDLNFNYKKDKRILSNINFSITRGEKIGIVGETGSGKSTLIDIISGLLLPDSGYISIDNLVLNKNNIEGWKKNVSLVSQNIFLFDSSILENITLSSENEFIDFKKLNEVCKIAELTDFIKNQPEGFNSKVGEKGIRISGGQKQRIAIARALYNTSNLLILDEATSALDHKTENKVMKNIIDYSQNLTLIIIAHRLTTLKKCDKIFKIETNGLKVFNNYTTLIKNEKIDQ